MVHFPGVDSGHPAQQRNLTIAATVLRAGLGLWFVGSGGWKLWVSGLDRFTRDIGNYQLPFIKPPFDAVAAFTVPWIEIVAGLCLVVGLWRRATLLVFAGLVTVFAICIGWAWSQNLQIACGCHGGDKPVRYWFKVAEFAGYYLAFGMLWWEAARRRQSIG